MLKQKTKPLTLFLINVLVILVAILTSKELLRNRHSRNKCTLMHDWSHDGLRSTDTRHKYDTDTQTRHRHI